VRGVLSSFAADPDLRARWFEAVLLPRRASTARALRAGMARGELRADLDVEQVLDALAGRCTTAASSPTARSTGRSWSARWTACSPPTGPDLLAPR
jgi:hypothetical protein